MNSHSDISYNSDLLEITTSKMMLIATLLTVFLYFSVAERNSLSQVHEYPETQIYSNYREPGDTKSIYVRCNSSLPESVKQCIVTLTLDAFEKHPGETKECPVNLKPELPSGLIYSFVWIHAFGNDKVLLIWMETQNSKDSKDHPEWTIVKTTVVHMFDNCRKFETKVHAYAGPPRPGQIIGRNVVFPIVFDDTYELKIGGVNDNCTEPLSKCDFYFHLYKFDDQGRRIGEVEDWSKSTFNATRDVIFVDPVNLRRSEKAYFLQTNYDESCLLELMYRKSDGYQKVQLRKNSCEHSSRMVYQRSLINEAIGFCYLCANSRFGCWQSDQKGHIHLETQFTLGHPYTTDVSAVSNLQNGGLLLAAIKSENSNANFSGIRSMYYDNYYFMKVDVKGNVESVEVEFKTKCYYKDYHVSTILFKNKLGQYCIVRLCESEYDASKQPTRSRIKTLVRCYSSDEFSKCINSKCF